MVASAKHRAVRLDWRAGRRGRNDGSVRDVQVAAEVIPERDAELVAGLHQAEKGVASVTAGVVAYAARDLALAARRLRIGGLMPEGLIEGGPFRPFRRAISSRNAAFSFLRAAFSSNSWRTNTLRSSRLKPSISGGNPVMTGSSIKRFKNPLIYTTARCFADITMSAHNIMILVPKSGCVVVKLSWSQKIGQSFKVYSAI